MSKRFFKGALCATALAAVSMFAHADLARVGPTNFPSPPGHGFPLWYQDLTGLALDLCLPNAADPGGLQQAICLQTAPQPYTFPGLFPDEAFYFRATTPAMSTGGAKTAVLVLALESAFGGGAAALNDQITFTRIRITAGVPEPGIYTVTHPYGTNTFDIPDLAPTGNRDIVYTEDVGVSVGAFTGALRSRVGPFLHAADAAGVALPPVTVNGAQFLATNALTAVTGSPFGTNYFEICGVRADGTNIVMGAGGVSGTCATSNQFTLTGRLHDMVGAPIGSPLTINGATYSRDAAGTHVNVGATVGRAAGVATIPLLTAASSQTPPVRMTGPDALDHFFTQGFTDPSGTLPGPITVTNSGDNPPTSVVAGAFDVVSIVSSAYDAAAQTLTVVATSSDKGFGVQPSPALAIEGYAAVATPGGVAGDPASVTLVASGVVVPPALVVVQSAAGGIGRAELTTNPNVAYAAGSPFTLPDALTVEAIAATATVIPVLANDLANIAAPINPASLNILAPGLVPNLGTVVPNADGTVSFTSNGLVGTATFKYLVSSAAVPGASNVSTVTITTTTPPGGTAPIPVADAQVPVLINRSVTLNVLANDSSNGGVLDTTSVQIVPGSVTGGTAVVNANGTVTFTAGAVAGAAFGFSYTVANTNGNRSLPAAAAVRVYASETLVANTGGDCTRAATGSRWRVSGTGAVANTLITLYRVNPAPAIPEPAATIVGTTTSTAAGAWTFTTTNGACPGVGTGTQLVSVRSQLGSIRNNISIRVR